MRPALCRAKSPPKLSTFDAPGNGEIHFPRKARPFRIPALDRGERSAGGVKFNPDEPVVVESFGGKPLLECLAAGGFELDQHLPIIEAHHDAAHGDGCRSLEPRGQLLRSLAREAGNRVHRNVTGHSFSCSARMARPDASRPNTPENGKNHMNQP